MLWNGSRRANRWLHLPWVLRNLWIQLRSIFLLGMHHLRRRSRSWTLPRVRRWNRWMQSPRSTGLLWVWRRYRNHPRLRVRQHLRNRLWVLWRAKWFVRLHRLHRWSCPLRLIYWRNRKMQRARSWGLLRKCRRRYSNRRLHVPWIMWN